MQDLSAVFLSTPKIATALDDLTGNLTVRVLVKLSALRSLPECHCMMDVGSLGLSEDTHGHTQPYWIHRHAVPPYFPNTNAYGPIRSQTSPPLSQHLALARWNSAGLESGRPNPSVRGGRGVCHPPLWALSSWIRERGDRGWWSCAASGTGSSSCRERRGQELRCGPGEALQPKKTAPPSSLSKSSQRDG